MTVVRSRVHEAISVRVLSCEANTGSAESISLTIASLFLLASARNSVTESMNRCTSSVRPSNAAKASVTTVRRLPS